MAKSSSGAASKAPVTTRANAGAGPSVTSGTGMSGESPKLSGERQGGNATKPGGPPNAANAALADTGPVVEHTGGGLMFEHKPSGSRAQPRKEQPTTPERAEIVEARRLELEINRSKQNQAYAAGGQSQPKVGDRIRVHRNAASGWEIGSIVHVSGGSGSAELDGGEVVGLEAGKWESAHGALLEAEVSNKDPKARADREQQDRVADATEARSTQASAKPSRAKVSGKAKGGKGKGR